MSVLFRGLIAGVVVVMLAFTAMLAAEEAKHSIKEVMKYAHKEGLLKKVASGQGTKADAEKLVELYKSLGPNKPPKGDAESWKTKTTVLVEAAQEVVDGKPGASAKLEKAANCMECHKAHKGG